MAYNCPLCGSSLTERHYHKVIKVQAKKAKVQKGELDKTRKQAVAAKAAARIARKKERETRAKTEQKVKTVKKQATLAERSKRAIRDTRLMTRIKKLEEEKKMLQKHTSPQEIGLADEGALINKLEKESPDDRIEHAGKGGDVLHYVMFDAEEAGCIVYECKRKDRILSKDVNQTAQATAFLLRLARAKGFLGSIKKTAFSWLLKLEY
ncbi:MAG: hypothetical protein L0H94_00960 [Nitrospira sp.]|nr:hypothetical protein [Nitrospira sp.]